MEGWMEKERERERRERTKKWSFLISRRRAGEIVSVFAQFHLSLSVLKAGVCLL